MMLRKCKCFIKLSIVKLDLLNELITVARKEKIEQRGAIAKDVNLDVQIFKPQ